MCNLSSIDVVENKADASVAFMVGTIEFVIPLEAYGTLFMEAEIARMEAELKHKEGFLQGVLKKLGNEKFVNNAPAAVLEMERKYHQISQGKYCSIEKGITVRHIKTEKKLRNLQLRSFF